MTIGISPPTSAVNPKTQCTREGCGTMLLTDGTCPRCDPPTRRTTDEKMRLAKEYGDERLARRAQHEIDNDIATKGGRPAGAPGFASLTDLDQCHDRIDALQTRIGDALKDLRDELLARLETLTAPPPAVVNPSGRP